MGQGDRTWIPQIIANIDKANTARPYQEFAEALIGNLYPAGLKVKAPKVPTDWFVFAVTLVVSLAIAIIAPELVIGMITELGLGLTITETAMIVGAVSSMLSTAAEEGISEALGMQRRFSWKEVINAAIEGGLSGGVAKMPGAKFVELLTKQLAAAVEAQFIELAIGTRKSINMDEALDEAIVQAIAQKIDMSQAGINVLIRDLEKTVATELTDWALYHEKPNLTSFAQNYLKYVGNDTVVPWGQTKIENHFPSLRAYRQKVEAAERAQQQNKALAGYQQQQHEKQTGTSDYTRKAGQTGTLAAQNNYQEQKQRQQAAGQNGAGSDNTGSTSAPYKHQAPKPEAPLKQVQITFDYHHEQDQLAGAYQNAEKELKIALLAAMATNTSPAHASTALNTASNFNQVWSSDKAFLSGNLSPSAPTPNTVFNSAWEYNRLLLESGFNENIKPDTQTLITVLGITASALIGEGIGEVVDVGTGMFLAKTALGQSISTGVKSAWQSGVGFFKETEGYLARTEMALGRSSALKNIGLYGKKSVASVAERTERMLQTNVGYNVSPEKWFTQYTTVGKDGTYITDYRTVARVIGPQRANAQFEVGLFSGSNKISYFKSARLEKTLGLEPGSLTANGFRFTRISNITEQFPRSPIYADSPLFQGGGMGLPNGDPELVINSIPTNQWPW